MSADSTANLATAFDMIALLAEGDEETATQIAVESPNYLALAVSTAHAAKVVCEQLGEGPEVARVARDLQGRMLVVAERERREEEGLTAPDAG